VGDVLIKAVIHVLRSSKDTLVLLSEPAFVLGAQSVSPGRKLLVVLLPSLRRMQNINLLPLMLHTDGVA
jgi:hypothetical protein